MCVDVWFEDVVVYLSKFIKRECVFVYFGVVFMLSYDVCVGVLCDGYGEWNDEGGWLVVFYLMMLVWG